MGGSAHQLEFGSFCSLASVCSTFWDDSLSYVYIDLTTDQ